MNEIVLRTEELTKCYGGKKALDHIDICIEKGKIYGLVGQNGAGKTTFMRVVMGLSYPTEGNMELFGVSDEKRLEDERKRIGSMIESPAFYSYMTAAENMEAVRISQGIPDKKKILDVLSIVDLNDTAKTKVKDFSMGMKQKLGIAMTLINSPEFLMLDEPTNGLDPVSTVGVRTMLQDLVKDRRMTVIISSHALEQLYHIATDYIFIHEGKILQTLTKEELDASCKKHIVIKVDKVELSATVLERELNTRKYKIMPDHSIYLYDYVDDMQRVISALVHNNIHMKNIMVKGDNLENYFVNLIGGQVYD